MAQYDIPILQENAAGKFAPTTLAPPAARRVLGVNAARGLELFIPGAASIYCNANVTASAAASSATWYKLTIFTANGDAVGVTPDHTTDKLTVAEAGLYLVGYQVTFTGTNTNEIVFAVYKNGTTRYEQSLCGLTLDSATSRNAGAAAIVNLAVNDTLELWFQNLTAGNPITVRDGALWCRQLS